MTKLIAIFIFLACFCSQTSAAEKRDGNWWRQQSVVHKDFYLMGILDGIDVGRNFTMWGFLTEKSEAANEARKRTFESFEKHAKMLGKTTTGQFIDGLNAYYSDFRNRGISVNAAMWPVVRQITGATEEEVEALSRNLRKSAASE